MDAEAANRLQAMDFTYPEVGGTKTGMPAGYHHLRRERVLGSGAELFRKLGDAVLGWQVQLGAGLTVTSPDVRVAEGSVGLVGLGVGAARLKAPVRVVYVLDEPASCGFAYGTLPGHPEAGEELFCIEHRGDDSVVLVVAAFSRPHSILARAGGPAGRLGQRLVTARYLRALDSR
jgi:uncharacterized protein (UPF0548 family)